MDFICDEDISIAFIQETWLKDNNNHTTSIVKTRGYRLHHIYRKDVTGGGVAIISKWSLKIAKIFLNHGKTFESVSAKLFLPSGKSVLCCCIYQTGPILQQFVSEFDQFVGQLFAVI